MKRSEDTLPSQIVMQRTQKPGFFGKAGLLTSLVLAAVSLVLSMLAGSVSAAGPGVHGRVFALDESGQTTGVVPGAKIEFRSLSGASQAPATAGPNGYYRIDLPPGRYTYKVTAAGFQDEDQGRGIALELTNGYAVYNFSLTKGKNPEQRKPPELPVVEMGHLEGRVLEKTATGELLGVPGARISLRREGGERSLERVTSQRQERPGKPLGAYAVELQTGSYRASVAASGFATLVDPQAIAITAGQTTQRDFVLTRLAVEPPSDQGIRGTVRLGGPRSTGPVPKIQVQIIPLGPGAPADPPLIADDQGRYSRTLAEGRYRVLAQADGYRPARSGPRDVFRGRYTIVNLTLLPIAPPEEAKPPVVVTPPVKIKPPVEVKPPVTPPPLVFRGVVLEGIPGGVKTRPLPGAWCCSAKTAKACSGRCAARPTSTVKSRCELPRPARIPSWLACRATRRMVLPWTLRRRPEYQDPGVEADRASRDAEDSARRRPAGTAGSRPTADRDGLRGLSQCRQFDRRDRSAGGGTALATDDGPGAHPPRSDLSSAGCVQFDGAARDVPGRVDSARGLPSRAATGRRPFRHVARVPVCHPQGANGAGFGDRNCRTGDLEPADHGTRGYQPRAADRGGHGGRDPEPPAGARGRNRRPRLAVFPSAGRRVSRPCSA